MFGSLLSYIPILREVCIYLSQYLRKSPDSSLDCFKRPLKMIQVSFTKMEVSIDFLLTTNSLIESEYQISVS